MSSRGVNKVIIIGNLGNDPEVKAMPNGDYVANFSLATSETWKDKSTGEKQEKTEWHRCVAFRKQAEVIQQYVKKGSKLYIEGRLQTRKWDKDGVTHYSTEIVVNDFQFLDSKQETGGSQAQSKPATGESGQGFDDFDSDIPF